MDVLLSANSAPSVFSNQATCQPVFLPSIFITWNILQTVFFLCDLMKLPLSHFSAECGLCLCVYCLFGLNNKILWTVINSVILSFCRYLLYKVAKKCNHPKTIILNSYARRFLLSDNRIRNKFWRGLGKFPVQRFRADVFD